jgi:hypothetical protein
VVVERRGGERKGNAVSGSRVGIVAIAAPPLDHHECTPRAFEA